MSGRTEYTFGGVTFYRVADSGEVVPWFYGEAQYTSDAVLGGTDSYLDIGTTTYPPLSFRASCQSAADRNTLIAALRSTGTLSNTRSHSGTVTLVKATPINSGTYREYLIDVTFIYRPS